MAMTIRTHQVETTLVVGLSGEIDVYTSHELRERLAAEFREGHRDVVIVLDGVQFMDSTGLGVLVGMLKRVRAENGSLNLVCGEDRLLEIFRLTGLDRVLPLHDSLPDALAAPRPVR